MVRPRGTTGTGDPKRIPPKEEVVAFFDRQIKHYTELKEMYLNEDLLAYRGKDGHLIFTKR